MLPMLWLPAELILVCICDRSANMCARLVCVSKAVRLHLLQTARDSNIHLRLLVPVRPTDQPTSPSCSIRPERNGGFSEARDRWDPQRNRAFRPAAAREAKRNGAPPPDLSFL